jgi:hypothetical protein
LEAIVRKRAKKYKEWKAAMRKRMGQALKFAPAFTSEQSALAVSSSWTMLALIVVLGNIVS